MDGIEANVDSLQICFSWARDFHYLNNKEVLEGSNYGIDPSLEGTFSISRSKIETSFHSHTRGMFTSKFWTSLQSTLWTRLSLSKTYHLEMDGRVERVNKVMKDMLRTYFMDQ